jgi:hypothetical protein
MNPDGLTLAKVVEWLLYGSIAGTLLLTGVLVNRKLQRVYRWFFLYQVYSVVESCVFLPSIPERYMVGRYCAMEAIRTILTSLVVIEIYRLTLEERRALAQFGRNFVGYAIGVSFLASLIRVFFYGNPPKDQVVLHYTLAVAGVVDSTQLVFLVLMGLFLAWFPVRIRKSLVTYFVGFVLYFSALWVILLLAIRHMAQKELETFNAIAEVLTLACICFWMWGMRRSDEDNTTTTGHRWNPEEMERLKTQLDEINEGLERLAR